mgnify:CR=1 FL=1
MNAIMNDPKSAAGEALLGAMRSAAAATPAAAGTTAAPAAPAAAAVGTVEEAGGKAAGPASGEEDEEEADIPGECGCCYGNGWEWYGLVVWMGVRWVGVVGQWAVGSCGRGIAGCNAQCGSASSSDSGGGRGQG